MKEAVGVTVSATASNTDISGVCVGMMGTGVDEGRMPPGGVGVKYCPHNEPFPAQDANKKDVAIIKPIRYFTK
jgi:hypothetical protein